MTRNLKNHGKGKELAKSKKPDINQKEADHPANKNLQRKNKLPKGVVGV